MSRSVSVLFALFLGVCLVAVACGADAADVATERPEPVESVTTIPETTSPETTSPETVSPDEEKDPMPTPDVDPESIVLIWSETGGCAMGGPNCARYEIAADGSVTTYREGSDEAAASGALDPAVVQSWVETASAVDVDALVGRLGPGQMTAAFDGIDYMLEAPAHGISLSSVDVEFDRSEPLFSQTFDLVNAAFEVAPLTIEMR